MTARHHHYLPQCYLKGFTINGGKNSQLTAIDFRNKKCFKSIPKKVGGDRDFNRINVNGLDQNALEKSLSKFERAVDRALRKLEETFEFKGETKNLILNLIALLAVRSPAMREHRTNNYAQTAEKIMDISLATEERWESLMMQMKESGKKINEDITYEDIKNFHKSKNYKIRLARELHIHSEFVSIESILPYLDERNWLLIKSNHDSGPFITSDNPVNLTWKEPEKVPAIDRNSPGYGMKNTQVNFPVSRNLALVGEFEGYEGVIEGNKELISVFNSQMLMFTYKQIYSPTIGFYFTGEDGELIEGSQLLKYIDD